MNNISIFSNCYGCGVCVKACPSKIITLSLNKDGFYVPRVNKQDCTECGLCLAVCAYAAQNVTQVDIKIKAYAAWSQNVQVRKNCSSGGIGFEVGRYLLEKGFKVCGVRYNLERNRAEHYIASNETELISSMGSKYMQSYTVGGWSQINKNENYLVIGTPCQIDSFRRYIQKYKIESHFILMDFFCHGVPSMLMWNKYLAEVEKKVGKTLYISWRSKLTGWHDSYNMLIKGEKAVHNSKLSQGDLFYCMFLNNVCLNKACYNKCKYKYLSSAADIRIGDLWGKTFQKNEEGVTGVVGFTERGLKVVNSVPGVVLQEYPIDVVTEGQMKKNVSLPFLLHSWTMFMLKSTCSIYAFKPLLFICKLINYGRIRYSRLKSIIKKA